MVEQRATGAGRSGGRAGGPAGHGAEHRTWTYRPRSSAWYAAAAGAFVAMAAWAHLEAQGAAPFLRALPWYLAVALVVWSVTWRPTVTVDDDGVRLVNPWHTVRVPWAALIAVTTRYALALRTPSGSYTAWAAPGPSRHQALGATGGDLRAVPHASRDGRGAVPLGDVPVAPAGVVAVQVRRRWQALADDGLIPLGEAETTPVGTTWHRGTLAGLAALLLAGAVLALA